MIVPGSPPFFLNTNVKQSILAVCVIFSLSSLPNASATLYESDVVVKIVKKFRGRSQIYAAVNALPRLKIHIHVNWLKIYIWIHQWNLSAWGYYTGKCPRISPLPPLCVWKGRHAKVHTSSCTRIGHQNYANICVDGTNRKTNTRRWGWWLFLTYCTECNKLRTSIDEAVSTDCLKY